MSKKKKTAQQQNDLTYYEKHGDLPHWETVAPRDFRGREREKDPDREKPLAPDGISGYW